MKYNLDLVMIIRVECTVVLDIEMIKTINFVINLSRKNN